MCGLVAITDMATLEAAGWAVLECGGVMCPRCDAAGQEWMAVYEPDSLYVVQSERPYERHEIGEGGECP